MKGSSKRTTCSCAGADYFAMLVHAFAREAAGPAHSHLAAFHALVPALTLNVVEASLLAKEGLARQRRGNNAIAEVAFTDDGFALGLAYLLKVCNISAWNTGGGWVSCLVNCILDRVIC